MRALAPLVLCFALLVSASGAQAGESVWSGIVIAQNVANPAPMPPELKPFEGTLKAIFGYNQFQVIGQERRRLKTGEEEWLARSKYFSLQVKSQAAEKAGYALNLKLYQESKVLLETEARLTESSPLVIRGPQIGDGQLVVLLVLE